MVIIAGLGNPGREYEHTRHNAGFDVIDALSEAEGISVREPEHKALVGKGFIAGQRVLLAKPQTYMNSSGESIRELTDYYKIDPTRELIVISDDITLAPGQIRVRKKGSAGGHNGLKSIIAQLGTDGFQRVKLGVGEKPADWDLVDHVLGRFEPDDRKLVDEAIVRAADAIRMMLTDGADAAMNEFNAKSKESI